MNVILVKFIELIQRLEIFLKNKQPTEKPNLSIINLAPKVLTEPEDLEKIQPYLSSLKGALDASGITNIAITGNYGSGKSTILKTFESQYPEPEYKYLNLSLASFKDNKKVDDETFERQLEISLLQQMFYHVKPSEIPDSRFKRIVNVRTSHLYLYSLFVISWILSVLMLFKFDYLMSLNPRFWNIQYPFNWWAFLSSTIFCAGIGLLIIKIFRLLSNSKVSKLSIKGEMELGEAVDKSVFNQHLEEILYFFERTAYDVVIIEDVDRFDSTDIFTKLREINVLLNNSRLIKRPIKFVYAVRDEMFKDRRERVKFFEFIIPVIPFINPSNAKDQLVKLLNEAGLNDVLSEDFKSDIMTFINDIDMRLLINIFHEFQIYRKFIESLHQDKLFAILVYKNLFPEDFGKLAKREGELFDFFKNKSSYVTDLRKGLMDQIEHIDVELNILKKEASGNIKELRAVYINRLVSRLAQFHAFDINGKEVSMVDILDSKNFDEIKNKSNVSYVQYHARGNYGIQHRNVNGGVGIKDIEKEVSSLTYLQREQLIVDKKNNRSETLKLERHKLQYQINELNNSSIQEIFQQIDIRGHLKGFKDQDLMTNLFQNGYIDEHYDDYISLFHEVSLTKDDYHFDRNVKAGISLSFEYELTHVENIIKGLPVKYFQGEAILNYSLYECLLENRERFSDQLESTFEYLKKNGDKQFDFITGFIESRPDWLPLFINLVCSHKPGLWHDISKRPELPDESVKRFVAFIFENADLQDITKLEGLDSLISYLTDLPKPLAYLSSLKDLKNIKQFISDREIHFNQLDHPKAEFQPVFEFIYRGNCYVLSQHNISVIIQGNGKALDLEKLGKSHYTIISELELDYLDQYIDENIEEYIVNVMLMIDDNSQESEDSVCYLINREDVDEKIKERILSSQNVIIKDIRNIEDLEVRKLALSKSRVEPTWQNVFEYCEDGGGDKFDLELIHFLNEPTNYKMLSQSSMSEVNSTVDFTKSIAVVLLNCHDLSDEAYVQLVNSLPYPFSSIAYGDFNPKRLRILIDQRILSLSETNYVGLKDVHDDLAVSLIANNQENFGKNYSELGLMAADWVNIFISTEIDLQIKLDLIADLDDEILTDPQVARKMYDVLPDNMLVPLSYDVLKAIFNTVYANEKRIRLLNLHFTSLASIQIKELIKIIGGDYLRIFKKQHKPTFTNTEYNRELVENLESENLIIRFELKNNKKEIKVFAKY